MKQKIIKVQRTYMELKEFSLYEEMEIPEDCHIMQLRSITVKFYRYLYDAVGEGLNWVDRKLIPDSELLNIISANGVEIYVCYYHGHPAGYSEIDRSDPFNIELAYFGILPEFRGKGLGKYLLNWTIAKTLDYKSGRLWLHTCSLDHPYAIDNYKKRGFKIYKNEIVDQVILY